MKSYLIRSQYLKDIVLNSQANLADRHGGRAPGVEVDVSVEARIVEPQLIETAIIVKFQATQPREAEGPPEEAEEDEMLSAGKTLFIGRVAYAAVFSLNASAISPEDENQISSEAERVSMITVPTLIFPFVRQIIASAVGDAGFPPLLILPIDFEQMYLQNKQP